MTISNNGHLIKIFSPVQDQDKDKDKDKDNT